MGKTARDCFADWVKKKSQEEPKGLVKRADKKRVADFWRDGPAS